MVPGLSGLAEQEVRHEGREVRVVSLDALHLGQARLVEGDEEALGGRVHHDEVARGVGDQDGIRDRVDDEVEPIALGPDLRLGGAELLVVLLDLLGRAPEVGDVPQDGHDPHAHARVTGRRADQLEEEIRSLGGIHQGELAGRGRQLLHGAPAERRGEQHVVDGHRPAATLALALPRREEALGSPVRDDHAALGVGEDDRVRDLIEDAVEEVPLPTKAPLGLDAGRPQPRAHEPVAEILGHPLELGVARRHRADQEEPSRGPSAASAPWSGKARKGARREKRCPAVSRARTTGCDPERALISG